MFMTTAFALALTGSLQTQPAPALPPSPPAAIVQQYEQTAQETQLPEAEPQAEAPSGAPQTDPAPQAPEPAPETPKPAPQVPAVDTIPESIAGAAQSLQDQIVSAVTVPEAPKPEEKKPEISSDQQRFGTVLGSYTTSYSARQSNRSTNIRLSATAISGVILQPGETFSFNTVVGRRTAARGYKVANVYSGGKIEEGIGGGICQVSSTLFNAALLSNMTITSRTCHGLPVGYLPAGRDATVSWGGPEFKFKNPYSFPVKITAGYDSGRGTITCSVLGPESVSAPNVKISVTSSGGVYTTKRSVDGKVNYTTKSQYKQPKN